MQRMMAAQLKNGTETVVRAPLADKKHLTHKRMERWIRLQQFVYGLPADYSYAVCVKETPSGHECRTFVKVGWMAWFGRGEGSDRQHSIAVALLNTAEAVSLNSSAVFLHRMKSVLRSRLIFWKAKAARPESRAVAAGLGQELLAG